MMPAMDDTTRIGALAALVVILLGAFFFLRREAATQQARRAAEARAMAEMELAARTRDQLGEATDKDARIAELERQLDELRRDDAARMSAPHAARTVAAESAPAPAPEATTPAPASAAAVAWLQRIHAERFAALTPAALSALTELDLRGGALTDADLVHIASLPNVTALNLRGTQVTDAGLQHLAASRLHTLELRGTQVTHFGLFALPVTSRHVDLTDTRASAEACRFLPPLPDLHTLKLNRLPLTDASLDALPPLPSLRHLEIDGTQVTAAGVQRLLARYPRLVRLEVRGVGLPSEAVAEIARLYPQLAVVVDSGVPGMGR
jgi:hypothetical protein